MDTISSTSITLIKAIKDKERNAIIIATWKDLAECINKIYYNMDFVVFRACPVPMVTLKIKTNYPNIVYKSLLTFASPCLLQRHRPPFPPVFWSSYSGLLAPLTLSLCESYLTNSCSSFTSQVKFDFLR